MKKLIALLLSLFLLSGCTTAAPAATESAPTAAPTEPTLVVLPPQTEAATEPPLEGLSVHFIDVGQADCALLECGGEYAIIDAGYPERASCADGYQGAYGGL